MGTGIGCERRRPRRDLADYEALDGGVRAGAGEAGGRAFAALASDGLHRPAGAALAEPPRAARAHAPRTRRAAGGGQDPPCRRLELPGRHVPARARHPPAARPNTSSTTRSWPRTRCCASPPSAASRSRLLPGRARQGAARPGLAAIGEAHGKSAGQLALRWLLDQPNVTTVPKASSHERQLENFEVFDFELSDSDRERIAALPKDLRTAEPPWAPDWSY